MTSTGSSLAPRFSTTSASTSHTCGWRSAFLLTTWRGTSRSTATATGCRRASPKCDILQRAVLDKCDATDGITDGVIDDPPGCKFDPAVDLKDHMCRDGRTETIASLPDRFETIQEIYRGPARQPRRARLQGYGPRFRVRLGADDVSASRQRDGAGEAPLRRRSPQLPLLRAVARRAAAEPFNPRQAVDKRANPPEFGWWEFNVDDVTSGKGSAMMAITDATNPDLSRYLIRKGANC